MSRIKTQSILLFGVFTSFTLALVQCSSGKYYDDFKTAKKSIDSLVIVSPYVFVKDQKKSEDYTVSGKIKKQISEKANSILSSKYFLTNFSAISDTIHENDLSDFFLNIDSRDKRLKEIKTPLFIQKVLRKIPKRYCLVFFFQGYYDNIMPHTSYSLGVRGDPIYFNRQLYRSDIRLIVFDNLKNNIMYYDKKISNINDPRIPMLIDQMTSNILRPIYYK